MTWTRKHQEFAAKNNWWQSSINIACYLYKKCKASEPTEIEFDSAKFQTYIKRVRGKKYHCTTPRKAVINLAEKSQGLVVILKDYGKGVFKLMVYPLSYLSENGNSSKYSSHSAAAENSLKSLASESNKRSEKKRWEQQQKYISKINSLLKGVGLKFDPDALLNIWRLSGKSIQRVVSSIELLLYRNSSKKVPKPHGFIIECLKKRWCDGFDIYYEPDLPTFESRIDLRNFVSELKNKVLPEQIPIEFKKSG